MAIKKFISGLFIFCLILMMAAIGMMFNNITGDNDGCDNNKLIAKSIVAVPNQYQYNVGNSMDYNGRLQTFAIEENPYYTIEGNKATDAGEYEARITLKDKAKSMWADAKLRETEYLTIPWKINKMTVQIPTEKRNVYYSGQGQYGITENSLYTLSGHTGTNAGRYTAIATLKDSKNYRWQNSYYKDDVAPKSISWEIKKQVVKIELDNKELPYTGKSQSITIEKSDLYSISQTSAIEPGNYNTKVTLNDTQNYQWSDSSYDFTMISWAIVANANTKEKAINLQLGGSTGDLAVKSTGMWYKFILTETTTVGFNMSNPSNNLTATLYQDNTHKFTLYNYVRIAKLTAGTYYMQVKCDSYNLTKGEVSIYNVNDADNLELNAHTQDSMDKIGGKWYKITLHQETAVKLIPFTNNKKFSATLYKGTDLVSVVKYNVGTASVEPNSTLLSEGVYYLVIYSSDINNQNYSIKLYNNVLQVGDTYGSLVNNEGDWCKIVIGQNSKIKFAVTSYTYGTSVEIYKKNATLSKISTFSSVKSLDLVAGTYYLRIYSTNYSYQSEVLLKISLDQSV